MVRGIEVLGKNLERVEERLHTAKSIMQKKTLTESHFNALENIKQEIDTFKKYLLLLPFSDVIRLFAQLPDTNVRGILQTVIFVQTRTMIGQPQPFFGCGCTLTITRKNIDGDFTFPFAHITVKDRLIVRGNNNCFASTITPNNATVYITGANNFAYTLVNGQLKTMVCDGTNNCHHTRVEGVKELIINGENFDHAHITDVKTLKLGNNTHLHNTTLGGITFV